ncbi:unnamed protein product [Adineta steineri]|uniref:NHL repeat containing protein n=1 Tax=Adineta steineri TaxID=433720 RepID=A0A815JQ87_9BILA|nr:unnamed protein product [Adineta steineri]
MSRFHPLDFRLMAMSQFQVLALLCQTAAWTISSDLNQFLTQQLATSQALSREVFEAQIVALVEQMQTTTVANVKNTDQLVSLVILSKPKFSKYKQNAITVAGGDGQGPQLYQLNRPTGIFIDKEKNIFIADYWNDRIIEWKYNAKERKIIAGGNGYGNGMNQLNNPTDVIIDQQNHSIIIADRGNRRVIQWLNQKQQILIDNIDCFGLAMDKNGFLYVSNCGNGEGDELSQLNYPTFIFVDEDQSVYVSDTFNHRVMKWRKDAKEGIVVAGGNDQGRNLNQLSEPQGVIVDDLGQIYVADYGNHRVMRWCEEKDEGEIIVGENGEGNQSNQLNLPTGLCFDDEGNLYVVDWGNDRIQKFEIIV